MINSMLFYKSIIPFWLPSFIMIIQKSIFIIIFITILNRKLVSVVFFIIIYKQTNKPVAIMSKIKLYEHKLLWT